MKQQFSHDSVSRYVDASPDALYDLVSDITRTPELSDDIVRCTWLDGATGPAVGARFKAVNDGRGKPNWSNKPIVTVADPGREFVFARTEPFAGTVQWRYVFSPEGTGTVVTESYAIVRPLTILGWFIIGVLYGRKDRQAELRVSMEKTLERIAEVVASQQPA
jgi:Polyketide cyclase / dehydrase and lipid transport